MKILFSQAFFALAGTIVCSAPCLAADLESSRSGAAAGACISVPIGGKQDGRIQSGLRLQMAHEARDASGARKTLQADALNLRLLGVKQPTVQIVGVPLNGGDTRHTMAGDGPSWTPYILGALAVVVVSAVVLVATATGSDDRCLDPNLCR